MSKITIDFRSAKDFDVAIDSIEGMSPRGIELAFLQVEKLFASMKGVNVRSIKEARAAAEKQKLENEANNLRLKQLFDEEQAKNSEQSRSAASARLEAEKAGPAATPADTSDTKQPKASKK